jgi:MFS family permease
VLALGANIGDGVFFRKIIFLSAIIGFCSLIPLFFVKEVKIKGRLRKKETLYVSISELSTKLKLFILVAGIFALANFSYMFFILRAQEVLSFGTNKIATTLMLYVLFNIFYAGLAIPFGKFSDKIGRRRILISGYLLFSLVCLGFLFFDSLAAYIVLFIFYGTVYAIVVGTQRAYVSDLSSESHRATALGFFQTTIGICAIISGIVAGMLYDLSFSYTFAYGFGLSLISGILFLVFRRAYK